MHRHAKLVTLSASAAVVAGGCLVTALVAAANTPGPIVAAEISAPGPAATPRPTPTATAAAAPIRLSQIERAAPAVPVPDAAPPIAASASSAAASSGLAARRRAPELRAFDPAVFAALVAGPVARPAAVAAPALRAWGATPAWKQTTRAFGSGYRVPVGPVRPALTAPTRVAPAWTALRVPVTATPSRPTAGYAAPVTHRALRGEFPRGGRR